VLERVGQRFLHDPVYPKRHARRRVAEVVVDVQFHRPPGRPHPLRQVHQRVGVRLRHPRLAVPIVVPEHVEQAPEFPQGSPPGL
jgi:hypothetical protein